MTSGARVGLVGCSAQKLDHAAPTRELYVSQLFKKASAYAEATCDRWYILSAKHGLIHPDTVTAPYDMRLGTSTGPNMAAWTAMVRAQLVNALSDAASPTLVALCGAQYRKALTGTPWAAEIPMAGMGIGHQLGYLTTELNRLYPEKDHE